MRIMNTLILLTFLALCSITYAAPSFDCKNAKTDIEKAICQDECLSDFDRALAIIYKQALKCSNNPEKIKLEQIQWAKSRSNRANPNKGDSLISALQTDYHSRIEELLEFEDRKPLSFFLEAFLKNPDNNDKAVVCLAIVTLLKKTDKKFGYNLIEDIIKYFEFIKLAPNKMLVLLNTSRGAYNETYEFYTIGKQAGKVILMPYIFSDCMGPNCNQGSNELATGNFVIDFNNKVIRYTARISSHEVGDSKVWKLNENCGELIDEQPKVQSSL